jgi:flagellar basal-body rod protein FlgF
MSDLFQIASVGLFEGKQRLEAVSENAANASLPGYRSHVVDGRSFAAALEMASSPAASGLPADLNQPPVVEVNLKQGGLMTTGRALDVAIDSDNAYFGLTDGTNTWLTRAGAFRISADGTLIGERGLRVVGTQGDVRLPSDDVVVEADGRVTSQGATVATLQLFKPGEHSTLRAATGSLLQSTSGITPAECAHLRAGALEASNSDSAHEMIGLMGLARQFEALTHVVQGYDEVLGRAIEKLGEV